MADVNVRDALAVRKEAVDALVLACRGLGEDGGRQLFLHRSRRISFHEVSTAPVGHQIGIGWERAELVWMEWRPMGRHPLTGDTIIALVRVEIVTEDRHVVAGSPDAIVAAGWRLAPSS